MALAASGVLLAACGTGSEAGQAGDAPEAGGGRVVEVRMVDMGFDPAELAVSRGETVTFRFTNAGAVAHEALIGDADEQAAHEEEEMSPGHGEADQGHEGHADEPGRVLTLEPGRSGDLTHTLSEEGTLEIGCHLPGHYAAGMKASVTVE